MEFWRPSGSLEHQRSFWPTHEISVLASPSRFERFVAVGFNIRTKKSPKIFLMENRFPDISQTETGFGIFF